MKKYFGAFLVDDKGCVADLYCWDPGTGQVIQFNTRSGKQSLAEPSRSVTCAGGELRIHSVTTNPSPSGLGYAELSEVTGRGLFHTKNEQALVLGLRTGNKGTLEFLASKGIRFAPAPTPAPELVEDDIPF